MHLFFLFTNLPNIILCPYSPINPITSEVWQIKKKRTAWESEEARMYFYAHARFANGIINLVISHTPPKFLRIMNFLGYQGTESVGLNELNRVAFEMPAGFTSKMSQLLLIYYWVYAKPHGENIPDDLSLCKQLVEAELKLFPQVKIKKFKAFESNF